MTMTKVTTMALALVLLLACMSALVQVGSASPVMSAEQARSKETLAAASATIAMLRKTGNAQATRQGLSVLASLMSRDSSSAPMKAALDSSSESQTQRRDALQDLIAALFNSANPQCITSLVTLATPQGVLCRNYISQLNATFGNLMSTAEEIAGSLSTDPESYLLSCYLLPATCPALVTQLNETAALLSSICQNGCPALLQNVVASCAAVIPSEYAPYLAYTSVAMTVFNLTCAANTNGACLSQFALSVVPQLDYGSGTIAGCDLLSSNTTCSTSCMSLFASWRTQLGCCYTSIHATMTALIGAAKLIPSNYTSEVTMIENILHSACSAPTAAPCTSSSGGGSGGNNNNNNNGGGGSGDSSSSSGPMSSGQQLAIALPTACAVFIVGFFIFGTIYKRYVQRATGLNAIPFIDDFRGLGAKISPAKGPQNFVQLQYANNDEDDDLIQ